MRGGTAVHVHYIKAGGQTVALYRSSGATTATNPVGAATGQNTRYLHTDHLGSVSVITDENQTVTERLAYDAWGKRRPPTAAEAMRQLTSATTLRGYTGHEMLDSVSLIHMNGRVYDPDLGRFLSADPVIQFPGYSQSYNRYSYVLNNPLSYTDPRVLLQETVQGYRQVVQRGGQGSQIGVAYHHPQYPHDCRHRGIVHPRGECYAAGFCVRHGRQRRGLQGRAYQRPDRGGV